MSEHFATMWWISDALLFFINHVNSTKGKHTITLELFPKIVHNSKLFQIWFIVVIPREIATSSMNWIMYFNNFNVKFYNLGFHGYFGWICLFTIDCGFETFFSSLTIMLWEIYWVIRTLPSFSHLLSLFFPLLDFCTENYFHFSDRNEFQRQQVFLVICAHLSRDLQKNDYLSHACDNSTVGRCHQIVQDLNKTREITYRKPFSPQFCCCHATATVKHFECWPNTFLQPHQSIKIKRWWLSPVPTFERKVGWVTCPWILVTFSEKTNELILV